MAAFSQDRAVVMSLLHRVRAQGMQQHPQVMRMARKQVMEVKMAIARAFHLPNMPRIQASTGLSIPEASFSSVDRARRPLRALVTDPSGAVLLGMNVQHCSPNGAHTPLLSQEHVQGHTILEGHQGSGSQLGRDALHGISGEVG